jgi:hypothetical protein
MLDSKVVKIDQKIIISLRLSISTAKKGNQSALQNFTHLKMLKIVEKRC